MCSPFDRKRLYNNLESNILTGQGPVRNSYTRFILPSIFFNKKKKKTSIMITIFENHVGTQNKL